MLLVSIWVLINKQFSSLIINSFSWEFKQKYFKPDGLFISLTGLINDCNPFGSGLNDLLNFKL